MRLIALVLLIGATIGVSEAQAASMRVENDTLIYQATPGEPDNITAQGGKWVIRTDSVQAGDGCTQTATGAECALTTNAQVDLGDGKNLFTTAQASGTTSTAAIVVRGGGDADNIRVFIPSPNVDVDGGAGDDFLHGFGKLTGGEGDDRIRAFAAVVSAGGGNDQVTTTNSRTVRLGPGNDTWQGNTSGSGRSAVYGDAGNDKFTNELGCTCAFYGGADNDIFNLVSRLYLKPPFRGQRVDGGAGADGATVDGMDCAKSIENLKVTKKTNSDKKYRCRTPGAKLK